MPEPAVFGEYAIESVIGEGGMGKVYRARQTNLDRCVALKVFPKLKANKDFIERFYNEARLAARLVHPNIIQIYSVSEHEGMPYFAMEYVEGIDLDSLMRNHPAPFIGEEAVEIVRSVAKALSIANDNGIIHRNIQPSTIMITRLGLVKVTDFGSAISADANSSQAGLLVGSAAYMSPEQGAGKIPDIRSDIYSLGCVFYECLCDHPPFSGDASTLIQKHTTEAPEPPSKLLQDLDPEIEKICLTMLAKDPAKRYQKPAEVVAAFAKLEFGSIGEMLLAKRVELVLRSRNPDSSRSQTKEVPSCLIMPSDEPLPPQVPVAVPAAPPPSPASAKSSGAIPYVPPARASAFTKAISTNVSGVAGAAVLSLKTTSGRQAAPSVFLSKGSGTTQAVVVDTQPSASGAQARAILEAAKSSPVRPSDVFLKLGDGRWSYRVELGRCAYAEGLAADVPVQPSSKAEMDGLGDCLLCCNWNKRLGCAMALNLELETRNKSMQLKPIVEQAIAWTGAGRFDMAVAMLDDYVKNNPLDPEGYRELARIYDRPDYNGKNKRRAVVLYRRFVELAKEYNASTPFEITRAEARAQALVGNNVESKGAGIPVSEGITFQCYSRSAGCYVFGVLTASYLIMARLGDTDPDTGQGPPELGGAVEIATRVFRRNKSDRTRKIEADAAKNEITRLTELPPEALRADSACIASVLCSHISAATPGTIPGNSSLRSVTIKDTHRSYELVFSDLFKSEQCLELLRRLIPPKKQ